MGIRRVRVGPRSRGPSDSIAAPPSLERFTPEERALIEAHDTPAKVQGWLHSLPYNWERNGETLRTFRGVAREGTAHCAEAALAAATILEQHGRPPLVLDMRSVDLLDHLVYVYRQDGLYGAVGVSREPALEGRRPAYRNVRTLVQSYVAPYIDDEACLKEYHLFDLRQLPRSDWRWSPRNVWWVDRLLANQPARPLSVSPRYVARWRRRYAEFKRRHPGREPEFYASRPHWL